MPLNSLSFIGDVHNIFFCLSLPGTLRFSVLGELFMQREYKTRYVFFLSHPVGD